MKNEPSTFSISEFSSQTEISHELENIEKLSRSRAKGVIVGGACREYFDSTRMLYALVNI